MHNYLFDVKLWACVRVDAASEQDARAKVAEHVSCLDIGYISVDDTLRITEASAEGEYSLVEVDGETP